MMYVPRTKIREVSPKAEENKFVRDAMRAAYKVGFKDGASIIADVLTPD